MDDSSSFETPDSASAKGVEIIRRVVADLPSVAGVYRMLNASGDVLYIGKAKSLKNRVSSYTNLGGLSYRIQRMVSQTARMEITTTSSEAEALLLEANLIKKLAPRYNVLLKDDKSFPFIMVSGDHDYPRISKHRGAQKKPHTYFGPFASAGAVNHTIALLQRAFLLRPCSDYVFAHRTRPCLQYQIKRCSAPCVDNISVEDYASLLGEARAFLSGKSQQVQKDMAEKMEGASEAQQYEKAAEYRDRIAALNKVQQEQKLHVPSLQDADILALHHEGKHACVQVYFFRGGQNFGNHAYFPAHAEGREASEILSSFIGQFYQTHPIPKQLILSHAPEDAVLLEKALCLHAGYRVSTHVPERGDKHDAITQALENAKQALTRRLSDANTQRELLAGVGALFGMDAPPERIEIYDNSHIMGRHAVGGMVAAGVDGFITSDYRRYTIKEKIAPGDDYAMMREVLSRRFKRLQKEDPDHAARGWPDLVLIDGGKGQLAIVEQVFSDLGIIGVTLVGISKGPDRNAGREQFHLPGREAFSLPPDDPVLHYLQRLRDEAHRYAIGSHRVKRSRAITKSELDDIPGIGTTRRRALIKHFGSARAVSGASLSDLQAVDGISKTIAQQIYDYFHG